jgi:hypothetical protein
MVSSVALGNGTEMAMTSTAVTQSLQQSSNKLQGRKSTY